MHRELMREAKLRNQQKWREAKWSLFLKTGPQLPFGDEDEEDDAFEDEKDDDEAGWGAAFEADDGAAQELEPTDDLAQVLLSPFLAKGSLELRVNMLSFGCWLWLACV